MIIDRKRFYSSILRMMKISIAYLKNTDSVRGKIQNKKSNLKNSLKISCFKILIRRFFNFSYELLYLCLMSKWRKCSKAVTVHPLPINC